MAWVEFSLPLSKFAHFKSEVERYGLTCECDEPGLKHCWHPIDQWQIQPSPSDIIRIFAFEAGKVVDILEWYEGYQEIELTVRIDTTDDNADVFTYLMMKYKL